MTDDKRLFLSRRDLLGGAIALPAWRILSPPAATAAHTFLSIRDARGFVVPAADADVTRVDLAREWTNELCRSRVTNRGTRPVAIKEVVLFDVMLDFPASTPIYGEAFQMLSQNAARPCTNRDPSARPACRHWFDTPQTMFATLGRPARVTDVWTGESLGRRQYPGIEIKDMPPHSARLLVCEHV